MLRQPIFANLRQLLPNVGVIAVKCTQASESKDFWRWKATLQNIYHCLRGTDAQQASLSDSLGVRMSWKGNSNECHCTSCSRNQKCSILPITEHKLVQAFSFFATNAERGEKALYLLSLLLSFSLVHFILPSRYLSTLTAAFCFFRWPLKTADQFLAVHPIREDRRLVRARRRGDEKRRM